MKKLIITIICITCLNAKAQVIDTIFANEHHNVALFFPEKIRQGVVGASNFVFSYNQEHPQYFGLLKGSPGKASNLLTITQDGEIYSYVLSYSQILPRFNYFLGKKASLGNEQPKVTIQEIPDTLETSTPAMPIKSLHRINYLESLSLYYWNTSSGKLKKKNKNGISLQVNEMIHYRGDVFVVFAITNKSGIDFEPEYLRLYLSQGSRKRNASYQKLLHEPIYTYKFPESIPDGQAKRFVYVFPKFTIGSREKVEVELREKNGNRLVQLNFRE